MTNRESLSKLSDQKLASKIIELAKKYRAKDIVMWLRSVDQAHHIPDFMNSCDENSYYKYAKLLDELYDDEPDNLFFWEKPCYA